MHLEDITVQYIKEQAKLVNYGRIIIEFNKSSGKVDIIVESRKRFGSKKIENSKKN